MKKWLMLALLPLLLLVQQEASATLTTLISPPSGTVPPANYSLTLTMNTDTDVINVLAAFDNTVTLTRVGQTLSDKSLLQLLITDPPPPSEAFLNIASVSGLSSDLVVTSYTTELNNFTITPYSAGGGTIAGTLDEKNDNSGKFTSIAEWFDTTYWDNANDGGNPYSFMQQCGGSPCSEDNISTTQYPLVPLLSVPVPNSSMLLVIGLAALMVTLRRTRQFQ